MKNKKLIALVLSFVIIVASLIIGFTAFGSDTEWRYDSETDTLYISGSGDMDDYGDVYSTPWSDHVLSVKKLVVESGVTSVGNNALSGASLLSEVELADTVTKIGNNSFASCPSLMTLNLGSNISYIGDESFAKVGIDDKSGFKINCEVASYALDYALDNKIDYNCDEVKCGEKDVSLYKSMTAYYPYTPKISGTYRFYSVSLDDTEGYVYSSDMTRLAYNDDHSGANTFNSDMSSVDFALTVQLTAGNKYYFATQIINPSLTAKYKAYLEPVSFDVTGKVYAIKNKKGEFSDYVLTGAKINGAATNNGEYTFSYNVNNTSAEFTCDNMTVTHEFNPDDLSQDIGIMMCDANNDGAVNGKDYRILKKNNSPYLQFFSKLAGYKY